MISRIIKVEVRVISRSRRLRLITLTENEKKLKSCFCFFADGKQHKACELDMITVPLEINIMNRGHTWHHYPWPRWRHRRWFQKFTVRFWKIRKEIVSSKHNNKHNEHLLLISAQRDTMNTWKIQLKNTIKCFNTDLGRPLLTTYKLYHVRHYFHVTLLPCLSLEISFSCFVRSYFRFLLFYFVWLTCVSFFKQI